MEEHRIGCREFTAKPDPKTGVLWVATNHNIGSVRIGQVDDVGSHRALGWMTVKAQTHHVFALEIAAGTEAPGMPSLPFVEAATATPTRQRIDIEDAVVAEDEFIAAPHKHSSGNVGTVPSAGEHAFGILRVTQWFLTVDADGHRLRLRCDVVVDIKQQLSAANLVGVKLEFNSGEGARLNSSK